MFESLETTPAQELALRHAKCLAQLEKLAPQAQGLLAFSRVAVYYLSGTLGNGVFWLPKSGAPVLMVRKGIERARLESPLENIQSFRSYGDIAKIIADSGHPALETVAAEMNGLTWTLANVFTSRMQGVRFVPGDNVLSRAQSVKTAWEMDKMRLCGERHRQAMEEKLPEVLKPGMNEHEMGIIISDTFLRMGHYGLMRMAGHGEENFVGHVSAGDSGNYPTVYNGPLGQRGLHPAAPIMGYAGNVWQKGQILSLDVGFTVEGYNTDKTQIYWAGQKSAIPDAVRKAQDFCQAVQAQAMERLRPGEIPSHIYAQSLEEAAKQGFSEGFMGLGGNKVQFLGHGIGLVIDAYPVLAKGFDDPLEEGMVLAVEPKVGIPGVGMVGVENTFEVTQAGARSLTGLGRDIIAVE